MNNKVKMLLTVALMLACLGYTFYNYAVGKTELPMLIAACAVLGLPMINIVSSLIEELKGGK